MGDQGFASMSNFAVGVVVARIAGAAGLGAFSLAYACWILVINLHRSLVTDPMAISNDVRKEDAAETLQRGVAAEVALGLGATVIFALVGLALWLSGQHTFGVGLLAFAPWVAFLDLQDYWRWVGFMQGKPGKSLVNDAVFDAAQVAAFVAIYVTGVHSVFFVISAWGFGGVTAAFYGLRQFGVRLHMRGGISLLRSRWHMSKWLAGNSVTNWGASQVSLIVVGVVLGPAPLGGLKAASALVTGPSAVVIQGGGSFGLPEAAKALAERGWVGLRRVSRLISGAGILSSGVFGLMIIFAGRVLLRVLYGASFARFEPAAEFLAVGFFITTFGLGPILILKATKQTRWLLIAQGTMLVVAIPAVAAFAFVWGVTGAAAGIALASLAGLVALLVYARAARRLVERGGGEADGVELVGDFPA